MEAETMYGTRSCCSILVISAIAVGGCCTTPRLPDGLPRPVVRALAEDSRDWVFRSYDVDVHRAFTAFINVLRSGSGDISMFSGSEHLHLFFQCGEEWRFINYKEDSIGNYQISIDDYSSSSNALIGCSCGFGSTEGRYARIETLVYGTATNPFVPAPSASGTSGREDRGK
jgi:hypothetical protein